MNITYTNCCNANLGLTQNAFAFWISPFFVVLHASDPSIRLDDNFRIFLFIRFFR